MNGPGELEQPQTSTHRPAGRAEREARIELARAALLPLEPGERPGALLVAAAVAAVVACAIAVGTATVHALRSGGGYYIPGGIFLCLLFAVLAIGMVQARYWAVVIFEALLVFQLLTATFGLILANSILSALGWLVAIVLGGVLFWKLVRVMGRLQAGRLQAPERHP